MAIPQADSERPDPVAPVERFYLWCALVVAAIGVLASVWFSIGQGLIACPLCLYERAFLMATLAVVTSGLALRGIQPGAASLLALGPTAAGLALAVFHDYLVRSGTLECPSGFLGWGTIPQQSAACFLLVGGFLLGDLRLNWNRSRPVAPHAGGDPVPKLVAAVSAAVLGLVLAFLAIRSAPPLPDPSKVDYSIDVEKFGCRPVKK